MDSLTSVSNDKNISSKMSITVVNSNNELRKKRKRNEKNKNNNRG